MTDNGIASIVRSLAEGVDPGRVLRDVAGGALAATETSHLLLAAMLEGDVVVPTDEPLTNNSVTPVS